MHTKTISHGTVTAPGMLTPGDTLTSPYGRRAYGTVDSEPVTNPATGDVTVSVRGLWPSRAVMTVVFRDGAPAFVADSTD